MPTVKQKFAAHTHAPWPIEDGVLVMCDDSPYTWDKIISRADCPDCLQFLMQLGRWAETRFYELP